MKTKRCRWCKEPNTRRCGVCLVCCNQRDEKNRQIDAGTALYVPPTERIGHRFYERKQVPRSEAQKIAAKNLGHAAKINSETRKGPQA